MATYAIGDVQGCYQSIEQLVKHIRFNESIDRLWFVGDLVNRGPDSLQVLRYIKSLGSVARVVLGNHDLFLLAAAAGIVALRQSDTIHDVLSAEDATELLTWLRQQPLLRREERYVMVHAGLLPQWTMKEAEELAQDAGSALAGPQYHTFLHALFHNAPAQWSPSLTGMQRLASVARVLTRIRTCTVEGRLATSFSGPPHEAPPGYLPWFAVPTRQSAESVMIFGHWAALGLYVTEDVMGLDSGCVWGGRLTAMRVEDRQIFQVPCAESEDR
jgi:bis(5'-nucleosyl)-tetraphosphatase (symmetrical)